MRLKKSKKLLSMVVEETPTDINFNLSSPYSNHKSYLLNQWKTFITPFTEPKEIDNGLDLLESPDSISCYYLDELGSMRFQGPDGIPYYVFIDENDDPYHIHPDNVYVYKPGEAVIPERLNKEHQFYIVTK